MSRTPEPSPHRPKRSKKTERICLKCGKPFLSNGPGNRICKPVCEQNNSRQLGLQPTVSHGAKISRKNIGSD